MCSYMVSSGSVNVGLISGGGPSAVGMSRFLNRSYCCGVVGLCSCRFD